MDKKILTKVEESLTKLLDNLGVSAQKKVSFDEEKTSILVELSSEENNALLVGYHGKNLSALQTILGLMIFKQTGQWLHIVVDVDDYRQKRRAQVEEMARRAIDQAKSTGQSIAIANLSPGERRQVHLLFADDDSVETHSEGEGRNRQLIVSVK
ncbi:MAG: single-stranded nucleic acid binding R3H domain-containing protein [Microgenomates bacterium 39_6]|nr:MAG: single-stranded nucleic acid binding R3H domain-containing protein [Microgenomates bacterium 39_6]